MVGSATPHSSSTQQQPSSRFLPPHILTSRIAEKQAEFESLSQLRDLSAGLASQMENLEQKLNCLADGTESTFPSCFCPSKLGGMLIFVSRCCGGIGELAECVSRN